MESAPETTEDATREATPSRRTIVKAAAWSVPVIALAVAAPQASASGAVDDVVCTWTEGGGTGTVYKDRIELVQPSKGMAILFATEATVIYDTLAVPGNAPHLNLGFLSGEGHLNWHFDNYPKPNLNDPTFSRMPSVPVISKDGLTYTVKYPGGFLIPTFAQVAGFNNHFSGQCMPAQWGV